MQITWSSPYTLPGTRMTFLVNVTVDGHLNSAVTSDNHYNVSLLTIGINSCYSSYSIHITISGINPAGEGEPASFVTVIPQKQNCSNSLTPNQTQPNGGSYNMQLAIIKFKHVKVCTFFHSFICLDAFFFSLRVQLHFKCGMDKFITKICIHSRSTQSPK